MTRPKKAERIRALERALHHYGEAERRWRAAAAVKLRLGATDLDALLLLDDLGAMAAGRIGEALAITTGAVTGLVDRLERSGWVERTRHETDRRQVLVELAAEKRDQLAAELGAREESIAEALAGVGDAAIEAGTQIVVAATERLAAVVAALAEPAPDDAAGAGDRAPIGDAERATLRLTGGVSRLRLRAARIKDLYRATFEGKRPAVAVDDGVVTLQYKGLSWFSWRDVSAELTLTSSVPWTIELKGGVSHLDADLRELEVAAIELSGGANQSTIHLPRPRGNATLRMKGGASAVTVLRPRGTAVGATIKGGANSLELDQQQVGSIGSLARLSSSGWDQAEDRWTIELTGGASHLSVKEE
jgi:DNA-binding MarR family transcriptional regulator